MTGVAPDEQQVRGFVAARYGDHAAATLVPAGAGEWSRAYFLRASVQAADGRVQAAESAVQTADGRIRAAESAVQTADGRVRAGNGVQAAGNAGAPQDLVIRFGAHRTDFVKDRLLGDLAAGTALPVPRVHEIGETPWGFFVTAQRRDGAYLDDLDHAEMRTALPALLRVLDLIAGVDPPGAGFGLWDAAGTAPHATWRAALLAVATEQHRTAGWRPRLDSRPGPAAVFERGLAALDTRLRDLESARTRIPRRLVHADLLNRNVLVAGSTVTAVLDWGNALYGDPLYDAAWLMFWWPWYPAWSGIDIGDEVRTHLQGSGRGLDRMTARLDAYRLHIGLDSLTYNAFTGRWDTLDQVTDQVDGLLRSRRDMA